MKGMQGKTKYNEPQIIVVQMRGIKSIVTSSLEDSGDYKEGITHGGETDTSDLW